MSPWVRRREDLINVDELSFNELSLQPNVLEGKSDDNNNWKYNSQS